MKRFLTYCLLFALPFVILVLPYFVWDPFKVLYHYDIYCTPGEPQAVNINRTMVSQRMFDQYHEQYGWNSYIFGSSRSDYYRIADWESHLDSLSHGAHMAGYGESLYGIWTKLKYMDGKTELRNVLICIDKDVLSESKVEKEPLWCPLPSWSKDVSWLEFHWIYLKAYLKPAFWKAYCEPKKPFWYDVSKNEELNELNAMLPDSIFYDAERMEMFYDRPTEQQYEVIPIILAEQKQQLLDIWHICEMNGTDYRLVINPAYDQIKLSADDMAWLVEIFGEHLYDFSGQNDLTEDFHHYYDKSHFRVEIAAEVMRRIYTE